MIEDINILDQIRHKTVVGYAITTRTPNHDKLSSIALYFSDGTILDISLNCDKQGHGIKLQSCLNKPLR